VVPGPRPPKGIERPLAGVSSPPVAVTRTARGWTVVSPAGTEDVGDLVEGLSLADLVAEEFGELPEPDRSARRSARGPGSVETAEELPDPRVAALERTVAQLEHALAARVSTERAIGVLSERHRITPRAAFESLRRDARSSGRPVVELAREVLDGLVQEPSPADGTPPVALVPPAPRSTAAPVAAAADGRS
jgi:ANTAR domain